MRARHRLSLYTLVFICVSIGGASPLKVLSVELSPGSKYVRRDTQHVRDIPYDGEPRLKRISEVATSDHESVVTSVGHVSVENRKSAPPWVNRSLVPTLAEVPTQRLQYNIVEWAWIAGGGAMALFLGVFIMVFGVIGLGAVFVYKEYECESHCSSESVDINRKFFTETLRALDSFKGILVILMTNSHVILCMVDPLEMTYGVFAHTICNSSAACFLGFLFAYGYSCDYAYLSEEGKEHGDDCCGNKPSRMLRSAMLPICGAWVTSFAWSWLCFKYPVTWEMARGLLTLYNCVGNGPDFLVCFTISLLVMYILRSPVNGLLEHQRILVRAITAGGLLLIPLTLTFYHVHDCTGMRKYFQFFLSCEVRDSWNTNMPGLPHLLYFNLGLLASRAVRYQGAHVLITVPSQRIACIAVFIAVVFLIMAIPLASVWSENYGAIMVETRWGPIIRGFVKGPSCLFLLGNLFGLYLLLAFCLGLQFVCVRHWILDSFAAVLRHLGANVLLYLVVGDIILAGLYRAFAALPQDRYPVLACDSVWLTAGILLTTRFLHYLAASGRS